MQSIVEKLVYPAPHKQDIPLLPTDKSGNVIPGIYTRIKNEDYHLSPGISSSQVKLFLDSPRHFEARYMTMEMPFKQSKSMDRGTMVHAAVLEPDLFDEMYTVSVKPNPADYPNALKSVDELKACCKRLGLPSSGKKSDIISRLKQADTSLVFWDDIINDNLTTKTLIEPAEYDLIMRMRDSVYSNSHAKDILSHGQAEQSVFSYHEETGMPIKCRPDWYRPGVIADLKTCRSAKPGTFARDIHNYKYHVQQAMYMDCCNSAGLMAETFAFIAVESDAPHICEVYILDDAAMYRGQELYSDAMSALDTCLSNNIFSGYTDAGISELSLPGYAL